MTTHMEEVEALNPHFKWPKQKIRREASRRARNLPFGSYAFGCRGHPGRIVKKYFHPSDPWGGDVEIESLIDQNVESCSLMHCNPEPISEKFASEFAEFAKQNSLNMARIKFFPETYDAGIAWWEDPNYTDEYKQTSENLAAYLGLNAEEFEFLLKHSEAARKISVCT